MPIPYLFIAPFPYKDVTFFTTFSPIAWDAWVLTYEFFPFQLFGKAEKRDQLSESKTNKTIFISYQLWWHSFFTFFTFAFFWFSAIFWNCPNDFFENFCKLYPEIIYFQHFLLNSGQNKLKVLTKLKDFLLNSTIFFLNPCFRKILSKKRLKMFLKLRKAQNFPSSHWIDTKFFITIQAYFI